MKQLQPADWAGTTTDRHDLHRWTPERTALCNPAIRTHSRTTPHDHHREPYATLRTLGAIQADGFAHLYRVCPDCEDHR
ncbi:hypothetical protein ACFXDE_01735 [Kitasatospora sp. NPDC059408]|uniref:hypothetical protein n=1 Tax=Kitasatospora sp. NPDC059408 TaxID=3346823 RepID=UPI0036CBF434